MLLDLLLLVIWQGFEIFIVVVTVCIITRCIGISYNDELDIFWEEPKGTSCRTYIGEINS